VSRATAIMTSPASTSSWFSGLARASSSSMAGGVGSTPASASLSDAPAAKAKTVVAAAGGKRKQLQGTLFKYGPMSAQVLSLPLPARPSRRPHTTPRRWGDLENGVSVLKFEFSTRKV
jgi:hypothetical protein